MYSAHTAHDDKCILKGQYDKFGKNYSVPADLDCSEFFIYPNLAHFSMLTIYLPKVVFKVYKLGSYVISEDCSLLLTFCSNDRSLLLFKVYIYTECGWQLSYNPHEITYV